jgi:two-component system sensor histidine kinase/response regulator
MPDVDGFELAEWIKNDRQMRTSIVLMLTSGGQPGDAARCRDLGVEAYLTKPVSQSDLRSTILKALGLRGSQDDSSKLLVKPAPAALTDSRCRVLVAEDNRVNQALAQRLLEKNNFQVVIAGNGQEVLEALDRDEFDIVLMDVQMPGMGGLEATTAIRDREKKSGKRIPIIAMTAMAMKGDREACLEAGMDGYVSKPIRASELLAALQAVQPELSARELQNK